MIRSASSRKVTTIKNRPSAGRCGLMGWVYWSMRSSTLDVYSRTLSSGDSDCEPELVAAYGDEPYEAMVEKGLAA